MFSNYCTYLDTADSKQLFTARRNAWREYDQFLLEVDLPF